MSWKKDSLDYYSDDPINYIQAKTWILENGENRANYVEKKNVMASVSSQNLMC